jgi:cytochrome c oxidase subunit II
MTAMRRFIALSLGVVSLIAAAPRSAATAGQPVHEIAVVAKKFAFEPSIIQVAAGEPVRLVIHSEDAVHGFAIRELRIDVQIARGGEVVTVQFTAPKAGRYEIACSEFCGIGHAQMKAALISVAPTQTIR